MSKKNPGGIKGREKEKEVIRISRNPKYQPWGAGKKKAFLNNPLTVF